MSHLKAGPAFTVVLLGDEKKQVDYWVDVRANLPGTGNGIFFEAAAPKENAFTLMKRTMTTLDRLLDARQLPAPQMIKLDVQV